MASQLDKASKVIQKRKWRSVNFDESSYSEICDTFEWYGKQYGPKNTDNDLRRYFEKYSYFACQVEGIDQEERRGQRGD